MARGIPGKHQWMGRWPAQQASTLGRYDVTKNDIARVTKVQRTEETGPSEWKDGKQCGERGSGQTGRFLQYQAKEGYEMVDRNERTFSGCLFWKLNKNRTRKIPGPLLDSQRMLLLLILRVWAQFCKRSRGRDFDQESDIFRKTF